MIDFKRYYAALLRGERDGEPRADEALRDYVAMLASLQGSRLV